MDIDKDINEVLSAALQPLSTTTPTQSRFSANGNNGSPSLRRSIRIRRASGESPATFTDRLLHRTSTGGVSTISPRTSHQSVISKRSKNSSTSTDRRIVPNPPVGNVTTVDVGKTGTVSNQSNTSTTDPSMPLFVDSLSDDDSRDSVPNVHPRSSRSIVLEHFIGEDNGFRCKLCNELYKSSRMSDANLRLHLGTMHSMKQLLFPSQRKKTLPKKPAVLSNERRAELNRAAINCIVDDSLSFGAFRRRGMTEFLSVAVPGYIGPHRNTVRHHLQHLYKSHRNTLRKLVAGSKSIALTADTWMNSRKKRFICLTGHFFTESLEHISLVLGFRCVYGRSLGKTLRAYLAHEIRSLSIDDHQLITITTDSGSDIKNAVSSGQFGQPIVCLAHVLHLVVTKGLFIWKKPVQNRYSSQDDNDDDWTDDEDSSNDDEDNSPEDDQLNNIDMDLILDDDGSNSDAEFDDDGETEEVTAVNETDSFADFSSRCHAIFAKVRATVKFIRNNSAIHNYVRVQRSKTTTNISSTEKSVVLDVQIRWNSTHLMLSRFLWYKDIVKTIVASPEKVEGITKDQIFKLKKFVFNHDEWDLIESLKQVLEPFVLATSILSGRKYPTIGLSMFICRNLVLFLQDDLIDNQDLIFLKKNLLYEFNHYFNEKVEKTQKQYMLMAAFLDPDLYYRLTESEKKLAKDLILEQMTFVDLPVPSSTITPSKQRTTINDGSATTTTSSSTINRIHDRIHALDRFADICGVTSPTTTTTTEIPVKVLSCDEELSVYISQAKCGADFRSFWMKHQSRLPRLFQLMRQYCIVCASSVPSEAAFSHAGYVQRKQRASLSPKTLQFSMLLKDRQLLNNLAAEMQ